MALTGQTAFPELPRLKTCLGDFALIENLLGGVRGSPLMSRNKGREFATAGKKKDRDVGFLSDLTCGC
jgi:hypothetical protein